MNAISLINLVGGFILVGVVVALPTLGFLSIFLYNRMGLPNPDDYKPGEHH